MLGNYCTFSAWRTQLVWSVNCRQCLLRYLFLLSRSSICIVLIIHFVYSLCIVLIIPFPCWLILLDYEFVVAETRWYTIVSYIHISICNTSNSLVIMILLDSPLLSASADNDNHFDFYTMFNSPSSFFLKLASFNGHWLPCCFAMMFKYRDIFSSEKNCLTNFECSFNSLFLCNGIFVS